MQDRELPDRSRTALGGDDVGEHADLCRLFLARLRDHAVVLLRPDGTVGWSNAAAHSLFGYGEAGLCGVPARDLYDPQDVADGKPQDDLRTTARDGHLRYEGWRVRSDGSRFWADVTYTVLLDKADHLRGYGQLVRDVTDSRAFQKELMRQALYDTLTGLPNRALLLDRLNKAIRRLERHPEAVAVFFVDLDRFKAINDELGHRSGDLVLTSVAHRLRAALRTQDTVARLAGDEFVVICEGVAGRATVVEIATRLAHELAPPVEVAGTELALHASIGCVLVLRAGADAETVLEHADKAMYRAKRRVDGQRIRYEICD